MSAAEDLSEDGFIIEIEQSLLGVLLMGEGLPRIRSFVTEDHFDEDTHRAIYRACCEAFDQSGTTHASVVSKLLPKDLHDAFAMKTGVNLSQYLARLINNSVHTVAGIEKVATAVVEQWARLRLASSLDLSSEAARSPSSSVAAILSSTGSALEEIGTSLRRTKARNTRMTIGEAGARAIADARRAMATKGGLTGVTWGLIDVDRMTGGMQRKELILMGARPSMGKSSVMISGALAAAGKGHGVGILSLEMDASKLTARALSEITFGTNLQVPYSDILRGVTTEDEMDHVEAINDELSRLPIEIDESPVNTFDIRMKIETMLERFERAGWPRLDCLMLDHLGFVQPGAHYKGNRNNEIGEITRALKEFAKEYDIAILLLSQLSRQLSGRENKRPVLSDLRDSGNIEQDADTVVFLHREAYYLERLEETDPDKEEERQTKLAECRNVLEFIIAKQRNGPVNTVNLWCDMAFSAVRNGERFPR